MTKIAMTVCGLVALGVTAAGCGAEEEDPGGTGGTGGSAATWHQLAANEPEEINANQFLDHTFTLPVSATVKYDVINRSTTTPDKWDTGILSDSEYRFYVNGQPSSGWYALKENVSTVSAMAVVPAGSYHFVVECRNAVERCQFSYSLSAYY